MPADVEVVAVSSSPRHTMSKQTLTEITLLAGLGVAGDAHAGVMIKHRSRVRQDPTQPNLRQVHLVQAELHDELAGRGYPLRPGAMGENITTRGIDLLSLPTATTLMIGSTAVVQVTGLRNPCTQLNGLHDGLMKAVLERGEDGQLIRRAGVMAIVLAGGAVRPGDRITVSLPSSPTAPLAPV
ncbi:MAG: domain containing protein [Frankiales bacterium]|nr:domain containing protein [Frankiales bacterium]